jgi:hypothetical protein
MVDWARFYGGGSREQQLGPHSQYALPAARPEPPSARQGMAASGRPLLAMASEPAYSRASDNPSLSEIRRFPGATPGSLRRVSQPRINNALSSSMKPHASPAPYTVPLLERSRRTARRRTRTSNSPRPIPKHSRSCHRAQSHLAENYQLARYWKGPRSHSLKNCPAE